MSNSIVRVRENSIEDSLILVIGEDGHITPDKETVQEYLKTRNEAQLRIMQVNKSDGRMVDVTVDQMTYLAEQKEEVMYEKSKEELEKIAVSLHCFRLDHDYTPFIHSPPPSELPEIDELDQTLSLLEGSSVLDPSPPRLVPIKVDSPPKIPTSPIIDNTDSNSKPIPPKITKKGKPKKAVQPKKFIPLKPDLPKAVAELPPPPKLVPLKATPPPKPPEPKKMVEDVNEQCSDDDFSMDFDESMDDDENDSDFEIDETPKPKKTPKDHKMKEKSEKKAADSTKPEQPETIPDKPSDKKTPAKKEKKTPKPVPNDFMLFSTPDIIRRVGGKECATPTPNTPPVTVEASSDKPASVTSSKGDRISTESKEKRLSVDKPAHRTSVDGKNKEEHVKVPKNVESVKAEKVARRSSSERRHSSSKGPLDSNGNLSEMQLPQSIKDIRSIIQSENTTTFTSNLVIPDTPNTLNAVGKSEDDEELLLGDNIDELLYEVAVKLADDKEFQTALDKSLGENMSLDASTSENLSLFTASPQTVQSTPSSSTPLKGSQIVRSGGRVVVLPPLERPTTRSRNKAKAQPTEAAQKPVKTVRRVIDDEHVSGGELDSDSEDGEDKDNDDPAKLWCICNQPHNNRFMICCDNCEEWYHGKCVNVTKQIGKMMEKEGKEWICLYCKDLSLKRPAAAARRVRRASRNSATDSTGNDSISEKLVTSSTAPITQGCIVCSKPCRNHSIFCSDACIVQNSKDVEKAVVFERATGKLLSGNDAPTVANLDKWLKKHPGFEVLRSKTNTTKLPVATSKISGVKLPGVKEPHQGASLALQKRGVQVGLIKQSLKDLSESSPSKSHVTVKVTTVKDEASPKIQQSLVKPNQAPKVQAVSKLPVQVKAQSQAKAPLQAKVQQVQPKPVTPKVITEAKPVKKSAQVKPAHSSQMVLNPAPIGSSNKRRKSTHNSANVEVQSKPKLSKSKSMSEPLVTPEKRLENVRDSVKKSLCEQLMQRLQSQNELKLEKQEVAKITNEIESQLFKCFGDTGQKYRNKYRSLIFNIKDSKNQTLWRSICQKTVSAYQLVRLSPEDLASQELALWRERENKHQLDMITKNELDQLGRTQQFVIKTHKGEQEVEDNRVTSAIDKTEMVTGLASESAVETSSDKVSKEKDKKRNQSNRDKHNSRSSKSKSRRRDYRRDRSSSSRDRNQRRRSRSGSKGSSRHRSRSRDRHRRSHKSSRHKNSPPHSTTDKLDKKSKEILENLVDNKIVPPLEDKLWKHVTEEDITTAPLAESDSDHEPTSTVTIPTPPHASDQEELRSVSTPSLINIAEDFNQTPPDVDEEVGLSPPPKSRDIVWSGTVNMVDVAEISMCAVEVSGDCTGLGSELPPFLDVVGRISPETVWDYISKMKSSNSKVIALLRLNSTSVEAKMPYIALYSYLQSRNRLGVVKSTNKAVKDFYILPLASHMPIPQALLPLSGPGFEESRPAILLGIIVRDQRKRPLFVSTPVMPKRFKLDKPPITSSGGRSYTPPPTESLYKASPSIPKPIVLETAIKDEVEEDMDEPYSPKDSDPDTVPSNSDGDSKPSTHLSSKDLSKMLSSSVKASSFMDTKFMEPFSNKFDSIPGLDAIPTLLENQQLQHEMEVLDKQIAEQRAEIHTMSQHIATTSSTQPGASLSNIELPSNIQQILDSIKTPQSTSQPKPSSSSDLTIPLILPKLSARNSSSSSSPTIPLNIPPRFKNNKNSSSDLPSKTDTRTESFNKRTSDRSVLSTLSDDELVKKAEEMIKMGEERPAHKQPQPPKISTKSTISNRLELNQPPIPGLD